MPGVAILPALFWVAWLNRIKLILVLASLQAPHAGANHEAGRNQRQAALAAPPDRVPPHIVVILADDPGSNGITAHGGGVAGGVIPTAKIDSIARDGVDFREGCAGDAEGKPAGE